MLKLFVRYIKRGKAMLNHLHTFSRFMCEGKYRINDSFTYISLDNEYVAMKAVNAFEKSDNIGIKLKLKLKLKKYLAVLSNFLLMPFLKLRAGNISIFNGNLILPGINNRDIKVFDFINSRILVLYSERDTYHSKISNYINFNTYFPMPSIFLKNDVCNMIIEELIDFKPYEKWSCNDKQYVINDVFQKQIDYLKSAEKKKNYRNIFVRDLLNEDIVNDRICDFLISKINHQAFDLELPVIKLHGDLWSGNLLFKQNSVYYIDWEYSNDLIFFFDLYFIAFSELFFVNDSIYIDMYYQCKLDNEFKDVFQIFGLQFYEHYRTDYIYIMLLNHYVNSWIYEDKDVKENICKRLKQMSNQLNNIPA